jgi:hypothetical protein
VKEVLVLLEVLLSVIANVAHNDLGVNGYFLTLHVSTLISRVSNFDVVTWENTMAQVQQS